MKKMLKVIAILIGGLLVFGGAYLWLNPQFGGRVTQERAERYAQSQQWDGEKFVNQSETTMDVNLRTMPGLIRKQFSNREERAPKTELPIQAFDSKAWQADTSDFQFIWFGHSVGLMKMAGKNLLIDPMFGDDTSPVGPFRTRRYSKNTLAIIDKLPPIDAVFITHDHYDHLDYDSFTKLKGKVGHYYVPIGVKRHLLRWNIPADKVTELDWWDTAQMDGIEMTFVPSRHFSGRGLFDRAKSLWGGWTFISDQHRVYWSGDGGYDAHFKEIGEKLGPFDWAFLECGQYNELWHAIHMYPEESVQAAIDVKAKTSIPIHWGAFTLALHDWKDPVQRFSEEAARQGVNIAMPRLGEVIRFQAADAGGFWWEGYQ